jgi:hypothetical protein
LEGLSAFDVMRQEDFEKRLDHAASMREELTNPTGEITYHSFEGLDLKPGDE